MLLSDNSKTKKLPLEARHSICLEMAKKKRQSVPASIFIQEEISRKLAMHRKLNLKKNTKKNFFILKKCGKLKSKSKTYFRHPESYPVGKDVMSKEKVKSVVDTLKGRQSDTIAIELEKITLRTPKANDMPLLDEQNSINVSLLQPLRKDSPSDEPEKINHFDQSSFEHKFKLTEADPSCKEASYAYPTFEFNSAKEDLRFVAMPDYSTMESKNQHSTTSAFGKKQEVQPEPLSADYLKQHFENTNGYSPNYPQLHNSSLNSTRRISVENYAFAKGIQYNPMGIQGPTNGNITCGNFYPYQFDSNAYWSSSQRLPFAPNQLESQCSFCPWIPNSCYNTLNDIDLSPQSTIGLNCCSSYTTPYSMNENHYFCHITPYQPTEMPMHVNYPYPYIYHYNYQRDSDFFNYKTPSPREFSKTNLDQRFSPVPSSSNFFSHI